MANSLFYNESMSQSEIGLRFVISRSRRVTATKTIMKNFLFPTLFVALGCATLATFGHRSQAQAAAKTKAHKVAICHGTASAKNPYVLIIVDESAKPAHLAGHGHNSAPDFALNKGQVLTPDQEAYFRRLPNSACGVGGNTPSFS